MIYLRKTGFKIQRAAKRNPGVRAAVTSTLLLLTAFFPVAVFSNEPMEAPGGAPQGEPPRQPPTSLPPGSSPAQPAPGQSDQGRPPEVQQIDPEVMRNMPPELRAMFEEDQLSAEDDPYWEETVERALEELESDDPEARRSAVMLLGKYSVEPAQQAVVRALNDTDSGVRMAALVSLFENPQMYPRDIAQKVIERVGDTDVSIRRIASNLLPMVVHSFPFGSGPQGGRAQRQFPVELQETLVGAFRDEDAIVRRNMVGHYRQLQITLPPEIIRDLLADEDERVAIQTVAWGLPTLPDSELGKLMETIVEHPSKVFRREVARNLQYQHGRYGQELLEQLGNDESAEVALEARLALFNFQRDVEDYREMVDLFTEAGRPPAMAQRLISALTFLGPDGREFLLEWLESSNPSHRQQAASQYLERFGNEIDEEFIREILHDSAQQVREQAVLFLLRNPGRLNADLVREIANSRHRDLRQRAASLAATLSPEVAEDVLLDLLLDNATEVRVATIREIGRRRIDGWEDIMALSLNDDDPAIQMNAAEWLLRGSPSPRVIEVLREYVNSNPESSLRRRIQVYLQRHGMEEEPT